MQLSFRKILSFAAFGVLAGAVYAVVYAWLAMRFTLPVFVASLVAFIVAAPVSYFGNRRVTYRSQNLLGPESLRFLAVQAINVVTTAFVVHVASTLFALSTMAQVVVAYISAPIVSFILYELWVYRQRAAKPPAADPSTSKLP
ncbi:MAG TPA: GtrA family protein [Ramlibacter sp.]|jgi:putative flippase GtrA|nr:GtrA family protein [Ramlibacter sp.]